MIAQVDDALRTLVRTQALGGAEVEVAFDAPTKDWAARRNAPTVNLYLYDIREDLRRRERGFADERDEDGTVLRRRPAPRWPCSSIPRTTRPGVPGRRADSGMRGTSCSRSASWYSACPRMRRTHTGASPTSTGCPFRCCPIPIAASCGPTGPMARR